MHSFDSLQVMEELKVYTPNIIIQDIQLNIVKFILPAQKWKLLPKSSIFILKEQCETCTPFSNENVYKDSIVKQAFPFLYDVLRLI